MDKQEILEQLQAVYDLLADKTDDETYEAWLIIERLVKTLRDELGEST